MTNLDISWSKMDLKNKLGLIFRQPICQIGTLLVLIVRNIPWVAMKLVGSGLQELRCLSFAQREGLWSPFCALWLLRKWHLLKWARTCYYRRGPKDEYETNCCIWLRIRGKMEIRRKFLSLITHPHLTAHSVQQCLCRTQAVFFCSETSCDLLHFKWALAQSTSHSAIPHLP